MNKLFYKLLSIPEYNSRFIALVTALSSIFCMLFLTICFVFAKNRFGYYEMLVTVLGGGVIGGGISRFLTKNKFTKPSNTFNKVLKK